jgi:phosphoglucomutase
VRIYLERYNKDNVSLKVEEALKEISEKALSLS